MAIFQSKIGDLDISRELLLQQIPPEDIEREGEEIAALGLVDWKGCGDPYFYENHHLVPVMIGETRTSDCQEEWIYYNTTKFSGKRLTLKSGKTFNCREKGVFNMFVWKGSAQVDGRDVQAGEFNLD